MLVEELCVFIEELCISAGSHFPLSILSAKFQQLSQSKPEHFLNPFHPPSLSLNVRARIENSNNFI